MAICGQLINDLIYNCADKSTGGLEQVIKLVNRDKISEFLASFTILDNTTNHKITAFAGTPADLEAVEVTGIPNKQLFKAGFSSSDNDFGTFVTHTIDIWSSALTENSALFLKSLVNGAEVVAFVKKKTSNLTETYWVYGFNNGLKLGDVTFNTAENSGTIIIPLSSKDPDLEKTLPYKIDLGTDALNQAFFNGLT